MARIVTQDFNELQRERIMFHLQWENPLSNQYDLYDEYTPLFVNGTYNQYFVYHTVGNFEVEPVLDDDDEYNDIFLYGERLAVPRTLLWDCEVALRKLSPNEVDGSLIASQAGKLKLRLDELYSRQVMYQTCVNRLAEHFRQCPPDVTAIFGRFDTEYR
jgi:hypothetical protein